LLRRRRPAPPESALEMGSGPCQVILLGAGKLKFGGLDACINADELSTISGRSMNSGRAYQPEFLQVF